MKKKKLLTIRKKNGFLPPPDIMSKSPSTTTPSPKSDHQVNVFSNCRNSVDLFKCFSFPYGSQLSHSSTISRNTSIVIGCNVRNAVFTLFPSFVYKILFQSVGQLKMNTLNYRHPSRQSAAKNRNSMTNY